MPLKESKMKQLVLAVAVLFAIQMAFFTFYLRSLSNQAVVGPKLQSIQVSGSFSALLGRFFFSKLG